MALSGSRLGTNLHADILAQLQAAYPCPTGLTAAQQSAYNAAQSTLATCIGTPVGSDTVTEITTNALVPAGIAVNIPSTAAAGSPSTGATNAPGVVT